MANSVVSTVIHDGARNVVVKVTGILDTSDYAKADITTISGLSPVPTTLSIDRIEYSIEQGLSCQLWWHDTGGTTLAYSLVGSEDFCPQSYGGDPNPKNAGFTGDLQLSTTGWATIKHFTLLLYFSKLGV